MEDRHISLFDSYTDGTIDHVSKKEFEARLLIEPDLRKDFETYKLLKAGIRKNVLEQKLKTLRENINAGSGSDTARPGDASRPGVSLKTKWYKNPLIWVAALALLSGLVWIIFLNVDRGEVHLPRQNDVLDTIKRIEAKPTSVDTLPLKPSSPASPEPSEKFEKPAKSVKEENLFASAMKMYVKPSNLAVILRSDADDLQPKIETMVSEFEKGNFQAILAGIPANTEDQQMLYLRAHSLFLTGKSREAAEVFNTFATDDFSAYHKESSWYRLLALYSVYPDSKPDFENALNMASKYDEYKTRVERIRKNTGSH